MLSRWSRPTHATERGHIDTPFLGALAQGCEVGHPPGAFVRISSFRTLLSHLTWWRFASPVTITYIRSPAASVASSAESHTPASAITSGTGGRCRFTTAAISWIAHLVLLPLLYTFAQFVEVSIENGPAIGFICRKIFVKALIHLCSHYLANIVAKLLPLLFRQILTLECLLDPLPYLGGILGCRLQGFDGEFFRKFDFIISGQHGNGECDYPNQHKAGYRKYNLVSCNILDIHL